MQPKSTEGISSKTRSVLQLLQLPGVGPAKVRHTVDSEFDATVACKKILSGFSAVDVELAVSRAHAVETRCDEEKINIVSIFDEEYPPQLRNIKNAPVLLYARGHFRLLQSMPCAAVVGTRKASKAGEKYAGKVAAALVDLGYCIVSGLALGIDAAAHTGALDATGITAAVLAHGLDTITPARNRPLASRILEQGGCLLSEHAPGVPPRPPEYAKRNRIQSGLSAFSVVIESGKIGGTIHQARFTKEQGRGLLVIFPTKVATGLNLEGATYLIREFGAQPITSEEDIRAYASKLKLDRKSPGPINLQYQLI